MELAPISITRVWQINLTQKKITLTFFLSHLQSMRILENEFFRQNQL